MRFGSHEIHVTGNLHTEVFSSSRGNITVTFITVGTYREIFHSEAKHYFLDRNLSKTKFFLNSS